ncbi:calcium-binding protein, partial [Streptomyces sp. SID4931]
MKRKRMSAVVTLLATGLAVVPAVAAPTAAEAKA